MSRNNNNVNNTQVNPRFRRSVVPRDYLNNYNFLLWDMGEKAEQQQCGQHTGQSKTWEVCLPHDYLNNYLFVKPKYNVHNNPKEESKEFSL